jgi:GNAT superfamily N-acetyltransferase
VSFTIRPARVEEVPRLIEIERRAAELFRPLGLIPFGQDGPMVEDAAFHNAKIADGLHLVADVDDAPVGFAAGRFFVAEEAFLSELDVLPEHGRKGVGAALVDAFCALCATRGARSVVLSTFRDPPWNAPFYARRGFVEIPPATYSDWIADLHERQGRMLDMSKRLFMRRHV